ncbi:MAG: putative rane protein mmpL3, partial [Dehalococcoidia bacterium]|nr:putative rane protein mmpL3 [Dehalococcoidia bacterium]
KNIASLLALGIAVDYSLFIVSRFREEIAHNGAAASLVTTMATAGKSVAFSGATTLIGLSGLLLVKFSFLRSLGTAGIVVVLISLAVALTLVPAVLAILGSRINAFPIRRPGNQPATSWHRLATKVMAHPWLFFLPSALFLVSLGLPFAGVRLGPIWASTLPENAPARRAWEFAAQEFGQGELTPVLVVVQSPGPVLEPQNIGALYDYTRRLAALPGVTRVESIVNVAPEATREAYQIAYSDLANLSPDVRHLLERVVHGSTTVVRVHSPHEAASPAARDIIERIRAVPVSSPSTHSQEGAALGLESPGMTRYVTGAAATLQDSIDALYQDVLKLVLVVTGSIYLALLLLFRSVVLAFKAIVMNTLSILASFGALVWIFQEGHLEGLLGFRADGTVEASLPILLFCMVFGLSMDYGIFLLSRIKEEYDRTGDNASSVASGVEKSGKIITSAAMVVVAVGCAFALGEVILTKALGLGLAIAVLLDATVVRVLLVPSLMRLLGAWNWWAPRPLLRLLPNWDEGPVLNPHLGRSEEANKSRS